MNRNWIKTGTLAALTALAGLALFTASAFAQGPSPAAGAGAGAGRGGAWGGSQGSLMATAAQVLGLDQAALAAEANGQSLAAVAQAHGVAVEKIVDAFAAARATQLQAAVAAGRLTQAQADAQLAALKANALTQANAVYTPRGPQGGQAMGLNASPAFVDADGDGVCDLTGARLQPAGSRGPRWNR